MEPVGKHFVVAVDVSTSLTSIVPGTAISTAVAAAAVTMVRVLGGLHNGRDMEQLLSERRAWWNILGIPGFAVFHAMLVQRPLRGC